MRVLLLLTFLFVSSGHAGCLSLLLGQYKTSSFDNLLQFLGKDLRQYETSTGQKLILTNDEAKSLAQTLAKRFPNGPQNQAEIDDLNARVIRLYAAQDQSELNAAIADLKTMQGPKLHPLDFNNYSPNSLFNIRPPTNEWRPIASRVNLRVRLVTKDIEDTDIGQMIIDGEAPIQITNRTREADFVLMEPPEFIRHDREHILRLLKILSKTDPEVWSTFQSEMKAFLAKLPRERQKPILRSITDSFWEHNGGAAYTIDEVKIGLTDLKIKLPPDDLQAYLGIYKKLIPDMSMDELGKATQSLVGFKGSWRTSEGVELVINPSKMKEAIDLINRRFPYGIPTPEESDAFTTSVLKIYGAKNQRELDQAVQQLSAINNPVELNLPEPLLQTFSHANKTAAKLGFQNHLYTGIDQPEKIGGWILKGKLPMKFPSTANQNAQDAVKTLSTEQNNAARFLESVAEVSKDKWDIFVKKVSTIGANNYHTAQDINTIIANVFWNNPSRSLMNPRAQKNVLIQIMTKTKLKPSDQTKFLDAYEGLFAH